LFVIINRTLPDPIILSKEAVEGKGREKLELKKFNSMKKKYLIYTILPAMAFSVLGAGIASAYGWFGGFGNLSSDEIATRQQTIFQNEAQILGISIDELKEDWAEGKTTRQIMQEKGITEEQVQTRMKDLQTQQMRSFIQALVDKGVITQAQADKRLQVMQNQLQNGKMGRGFSKGFRMGFGW